MVERMCSFMGDILYFKTPSTIVECQRKSVWGWRDREEERGEGEREVRRQRGREKESPGEVFC